MARFGQVPTHQSEDKFDIAVSEDGKAFTLRLTDFQVTAGSGAPPISSRVFPLVMPLEGYEKSVEIAFSVHAAVGTMEGGNATLVLSVNGQTTVTDFAGGSFDGFEHRFKFAAEKPSECRLCLFLLVGGDSKLGAQTIDAEILST